jgi:hypothetical protein|tara:strand:+ start:56 stop:727 length:672 start_codon:yes stop_codon:yes gene_type:complete
MGLGKSYTDQDGNQGTLLHMLLSKSPGYADFMSKTRGSSGYSVADPQAIRNIRADASSDPATKAALRAGEEVGGGLVSLQEGGGLGSAFSQGFQQGTLDPMVSTPIPPTADPYGSAAGLSNLMMPNVYTDVNSYNQGTPVGPPVDTQMLQTAQNFANPSVFSYNGVNQGGGGLSGMMPSGAPGSMNPMAGMQNQVFNQGQQGMGQQQLPQQQIMPAQPYTMGT